LIEYNCTREVKEKTYKYFKRNEPFSIFMELFCEGHVL
jgi:hypothetical protein